MRSARNTTFQYPGSKARISPWIVSHLPSHNTYVEPFGGSAAVLVNKGTSPNEIYNDIDGELVHFFKILRDNGDELLEWLNATPYSRELYERYKREYFDGERPEDDIERAGRYFYLRQACFNGKLEETQSFGVTTECRQYESDSRSVMFKNRIENLEAFQERFQRVTIENLDYREVIDRYDSETAVFYLDPPYVGVGNEYYEFGEFDHSKFFDTLAGIDGYAVVSYEELPGATPETWTVVERESKSSLNRGQGHEKVGTERLVLNFDPDETPSFAGANVSQQKLTEVQ